MTLGAFVMRGRTLAPIGCWFAFAVAIAGQESVATSSLPPPVVQSGWTQSNPPLATRSFRRARKRKKRRQKEKHKGNHQKHKGNHPKQHGNSVEHKKNPDHPKTPPSPPTSDPPTERSKTEAETPEKEANFPMDGVQKSPLRSLGVPAPAVPVVATAVSVSLLALWPSLAKAGDSALRTLGTILRQVISTHLRVWAKRGKKLDEEERYFNVFGFRLRPLELLSLAATAAVYGLALAYLLVGWALSPQLVLWQILAALSILLVRSLVRFVYERQVGLVTVFRFWPAGGLFCLLSAYLGTMMATGNYELEAAGRPDSAKHAARLRVGIVLVTLGLAFGFFSANLHHPHKVLQMGRLVASGIVLSEVLPVTPMPGLRIYKWRRSIWALLFGIVVPAYFLMNFVL